MPTKEGEELINAPMYIKDQDGNMVQVPHQMPVLTELSDPDRSGFDAIRVEYIPLGFRLPVKLSLAIKRRIRKKAKCMHRLIRNAYRSKEKYRRAVLKYGAADKKAQRAAINYWVAQAKLKIWIRYNL